MPDVQIREATVYDAIALAKLMRRADADEVMASSGVTPRAATVLSLQQSHSAFAGFVNGEMVALFGCRRTDDGGCPWLLGTDAIERVSRTFLRESRSMVRQMRGYYGILSNRVDDRNEVSKRWLKWLGFELHDPEPWGFSGLPFRYFEMR